MSAEGQEEEEKSSSSSSTSSPSRRRRRRSDPHAADPPPAAQATPAGRSATPAVQSPPSPTGFRPPHLLRPPVLDQQQHQRPQQLQRQQPATATPPRAPPQPHTTPNTTPPTASTAAPAGPSPLTMSQLEQAFKQAQLAQAQKLAQQAGLNITALLQQQQQLRLQQTQLPQTCAQQAQTTPDQLSDNRQRGLLTHLQQQLQMLQLQALQQIQPATSQQQQPITLPQSESSAFAPLRKVETSPLSSLVTQFQALQQQRQQQQSLNLQQAHLDTVLEFFIKNPEKVTALNEVQRQAIIDLIMQRQQIYNMSAQLQSQIQNTQSQVQQQASATPAQPCSSRADENAEAPNTAPAAIAAPQRTLLADSPQHRHPQQQSQSSPRRHPAALVVKRGPGRPRRNPDEPPTPRHPRPRPRLAPTSSQTPTTPHRDRPNVPTALLDDDIDLSTYEDGDFIPERGIVLTTPRRKVIIPEIKDNNTRCSQFLLQYNLHADVEFSKKSIESLLKKLKDKPSELYDLMRTVAMEGHEIGECVLIPRTLDGRLQVAGRKGFPHVVYTRIWRYPDAHKNEIHGKDVCPFSYDVKDDQICVNPYHYDRHMPHHPDDRILLTQQIMRTPRRSQPAAPEVTSSSSNSVPPDPNPPEPARVGQEQAAAAAFGRYPFIATPPEVLMDQLRKRHASIEESRKREYSSPDVGEASLSKRFNFAPASLPKTNIQYLRPVEPIPSTASADSDDCQIIEPPSAEQPAAEPRSEAGSTEASPLHGLSVLKALRTLVDQKPAEPSEGVESSRVETHIGTVLANYAQTNALPEADHLKIEVVTKHADLNVPLIIRSPNNSKTIEEQDGPATPIEDLLRSKTQERNPLQELERRLRLDINLNRMRRETDNVEVKPIDPDDFTRFCQLHPLTAAAVIEVLSLMCPIDDVSQLLKSKVKEMNLKHVLDPLLSQVLGRFSRSPSRSSIPSPTGSACPSPRPDDRDTWITVAEVEQLIEDVQRANPLEDANLLQPLRRMFGRVEKEGAPHVLISVMRTVCEKLPTANYGTPEKPTYSGANLETVDLDRTCSFKYFEAGRCKGPVFHAKHSVVSVGFLPSNIQSKLHDHFALGKQLHVQDAQSSADSVQRFLEFNRYQIGKGFLVEVTRDGDVYMKGAGVKGFRVASCYLDRESLYTPHDRRHALYDGSVMKVYDLRQSFQQMCFWVAQYDKSNPSEVRVIEDAKFINQMRALCVIRCMYNVNVYSNDQDLNDFEKAPCAVEFYVNRSLCLLEELVQNPHKARFYLRTGRLPSARHKQRPLVPDELMEVEK